MNSRGQFGYLKLIFVVLAILLIWIFFLAPLFGVMASTSSEGGLFAFVVNNFNMIFLVGLVLAIFGYIAVGAS